MYLHYKLIESSALDDVEYKVPCQILDQDTRELLGPNMRGELVMRTPTVMKGYLNRPDATQATIDKDGWIITGTHICS